MASINNNEAVEKHNSEAEFLQVPQWIMFGDSLTQKAWEPSGTGSLLQNAYSRRFDVICRGFSGYNTEWALYLLPHIIQPSVNAKIVSIWLGANDACLPERAQYVSVDKFKENIKYIINFIKERLPNATIVTITPPPVSEPARVTSSNEKWGFDPNRTPDRLVERTKLYADAVLQVTKEFSNDQNSIFSVDVYQTVEEQGIRLGDGDRDKGLALLLNDGLHLTAQGYQLIFDTIMKAIEEKRPDLLPLNVPRYLPWWDELDYDNVPSSFPPKPVTVVESQK